MANIFFFGDSITFGAWDEEGGWAERIKKQVVKKMLTTNLEYYHQIYNLGISGDTTTKLLKRLEAEIKPRLDDDEDNSCAIIFAIGINDSYFFLKEGRENVSLVEFRENLLALWKIAKQYTHDIVFIGLTPVNEAFVDPVPWRPEISYKNDVINKYNDAVQEFCRNHEILFVDIHEEWTKIDYKPLLIDGLHPNTEGHEKMYEQIIKTLEDREII